jgi:formate-dependent nitrite reductase membrane component NrfD
MSTASFALYGGWLRAWFGGVLGVCLILPTLLRVGKGEVWTGVNIFFEVAGTVLVISCVVRLLIILSHTQRRGAKDTQGPEVPNRH